MDTFLHKKFRLNLTSLINNKKLLIAISGGQDSICLINLINEQLNKTKIKIEAIYIDHQWENDAFIRIKHLVNIMQKTMISFCIYQIKKNTLSEAEARKLRYKTLLKHAHKQHFKTIITGHNYDDQVETIIHNLIRGTSINGISNLTNIKKINNSISINRPLINFTKAEIKWLCKYYFLPIWSDITNYNHKINRNRLRHEFIPYLKNFINPKVDKQLQKFISLYRKDNEYIKQCTIKLYLKSQHKHFIALNMSLLNKQHITLKIRVIQLHFFYHFNKIIDTNTIINIFNFKIMHYPNNIHSKQLTIKYDYKNQWVYTNFTHIQ